MSLALHPRVRALTSVERAWVLALALAVFLFAAGPVWRHRWAPGPAIVWSYVVIPPAVFAAFLRRGRPRLVPWILESLLLSVVKFGITAFVLVGLWTFGTPPPAHATGLLEDVLRPKSTRNSLKVEEGEDARRARRAAAAQPVGVGDGGFSSKVISLAQGGDVAFRATDGRLHTLEMILGDGSIGANVPILASGAPRLVAFEEISLFSSIRCAVHPEERARLTVGPRR